MSNRIRLIYWQYSSNIKYTRITSLEKKKKSLHHFFFLCATERKILHPQHYYNRVLPNCEKNPKQLENTSFIFQDPQRSTLRVVIWSLRFYHNSWQSYAKNSPQWQPITSINWFWIWLIWKPKSFRILTHHEQRVSSSASGFQWKISEMNNYILTSGFFVSYFLNMFILTFSINPVWLPL